VHEKLKALAAATAENDGVIGRTDALALGATSVQLHRWITSGRLDAIGPRALVFPGGVATFRRQLRATLVNAGADAVASHRSAAYLLEFEGFAECDPEVTVPAAQRGRLGGPGVVHSTAKLKRADRTEVDGFPSTTAARTIIDLAAVCERDELENVIDSAVRKGQVSADYLRRRLKTLRHRGRDGVIMLDTLLVDSGGTNKLERRFLQMCREAGLPRPKCQVVAKNGVQRIGRVDFDFRPLMLVVEVEGQIGHSSPRQRQVDARRRRELAAAEIGLIVFTYEDVFDRPDQTAADLAAALAQVSRI
jgi:very-short-patch-repair endonuclease